jgi:energy-coupling factor transport system permease protein
VRAGAAGALDRAVDVAAALEVRGYGAARRPPRVRTRFSRHDRAFGAAALALLALALAGPARGAAAFGAYPLLHGGWSTGVWLLAAAIPVCVLLPFVDRRGIAR